MQKEHQKQQQKSIAKTEKIVLRGKNKVHDQRRTEIEFFYQRHSVVGINSDHFLLCDVLILNNR